MSIATLRSFGCSLACGANRGGEVSASFFTRAVMTTDGTDFAREFAANSDADMIQTDLNVAAVQLAVADAAQITLPHGQPVVVVPVTPGETVQLPTDTTDHLLAEIGPQGNLAFVIDGRTVILQGYVEANEQSPVSITTNDGDEVDVAAVVAETDPSLDIQTAAGPAAARAR